MRTEKQQEASRRNGAKSRGPVTAAGKARSSRNALKHGLTARAASLSPADQAELLALAASFRATFHPVGDSEIAAVHDLADAEFRIRKAWAAETSALNQAAASLPNDSRDPARLIALAWRSLTEQTLTIPNIQRQEARLSRQYQRAFARLLRLRDRRLASSPQPPADRKVFFQNEPGVPAPPAAAQ